MNGSSSSTRQFSLTSIKWLNRMKRFFFQNWTWCTWLRETEAKYRCLRRTVKFNVRARTSCGFKFNRGKSETKILVRSIMRSIEPSNRSDQRPMLCTSSPIRYLTARTRRSVFSFVAELECGFLFAHHPTSYSAPLATVRISFKIH